MIDRVKTFLWNEHTHRPRLPWRLLGLIVLLFVLGFVSSFTISLMQRSSVESILVMITPGMSPEWAIIAIRNVAFVASQVLVMVGSVYLAGRFLDRRRFREFGFRIDSEWWIDLGFGLGLGALLMTSIFLFELSAGWVSVREWFFIARADFAFLPWFGWAFVTFVAVGIYEELLFRGYLITNLAEGITWFDRLGPVRAVGIAMIVTSVFFGVAHAGNPNATLPSSAGIVVAALMLAGGYVLTGELAIPIGIHITWNFFQGPVYGFPVSGLDIGVALIATDRSGPTLITGGSFGPEAGLIGLLAAGIGLGLVMLWVRWRHGRLEVPSAITSPELR